MSIERLFSTLSLFLLIGVAGLSHRSGYAQNGAATETPRARYLSPNPETGTSTAVVVDEGPLARTEQFLPFDADSTLVGAGDPEKQIGRVLENLRLALAEVDSGFDDLIKINVYAARNDVVRQVKEQFAETFTGAVKPAVTFMVGDLPHPEALVAMDAVAAVSSANAPQEVVRHRARALYGSEGRGHVAVLPPGGKVYVSGQADLEAGKLLEAVRGTMQSLHATLAYLGLSAEDVVQVKAFIHPVAKAAAVEEVIAEYYREGPAPPIVTVEWNHEGLPTEIELIAARGQRAETPTGDVLRYITPPGMSSSSVFSRVVEVRDGKLVFVSGLYGDPAADAEGQVRGIFETLGQVLQQAGSDFRHLVKATYYVSGEEAGQQLTELRPEFYDPERPPAASKVPVDAVGREGVTITLDMIAVPVNE